MNRMFKGGCICGYVRYKYDGVFSTSIIAIIILLGQGQRQWLLALHAPHF